MRSHRAINIAFTIIISGKRFRMGFLAVDKLEQGMVLEDDVYDINTRLLLSKGQQIGEKQIRILKVWGISEVSIVGATNEQTACLPAMDDEQIEMVKAAIQRVFTFADLTHESIKKVLKVSLIHRLKNNGNHAQASTDRPDGDPDFANLPEPINHRLDQLDDKLPETPSIISELNQVIADPMATSNSVARVVNKSPSLAATLLKIVNSAYYGFPSRIDRISRAVTIIGTKEISSLALGISVMNAFSDIPKKMINMQAFISHSLACGIISRIFAAFNNSAQTEQLFISGLLHDIGKLIVYKYYPDHATACFQMACAANESVFQAEKQIIGINHPRIAKHLLKKWKLPLDLTDNIVCHHHPGRASNSENAGIVHLADIVTHGLGIGTSGERAIPIFDYGTIEKVMASKPNVRLIVRQAVHQLGPLEAIFRG
jgi:HD-like signal output (HDOD) protein